MTLLAAAHKVANGTERRLARCNKFGNDVENSGPMAILADVAIRPE